MGRALGTLLATVLTSGLLLAGCGSDTSSTTAGDGGSSGRVPPPGAQVHLISLTGAGGRTSTVASPLNTPEQIAAFAHRFRVPTMGDRIRALVAKLDGDGDLQGAVIAVGCDRPPGASLQVDGSGRVLLVPYDVESPLPECLVAVTTVAIAVIPKD